MTHQARVFRKSTVISWHTLPHTARHTATLTATHSLLHNTSGARIVDERGDQLSTIDDAQVDIKHTATHCNILQHTAAHWNTLQQTATHCNTLHHTATHRNALEFWVLKSSLSGLFDVWWRDYVAYMKQPCSLSPTFSLYMYILQNNLWIWLILGYVDDSITQESSKMWGGGTTYLYCRTTYVLQKNVSK